MATHGVSSGHCYLAAGALATLGAITIGLQFPGSLNAQSSNAATYTAAQASAGKTAYSLSCASCHGANINDGEFAPPLKGAAFMQKYGGKPASELVHGFGDGIQALDAATGDVLWQYSRELPKGLNPSVKRNIAINGNKVCLGTSDVHVVARDVKTGDVVWNQALTADKSFQLTGGPLVAKGKVMIGNRLRWIEVLWCLVNGGKVTYPIRSRHPNDRRRIPMHCILG